jgi:hypothetical protein
MRRNLRYINRRERRFLSCAMSGILPTHIHDLEPRHPSRREVNAPGHYDHASDGPSVTPTTEGRPDKRRAIAGPSRVALDEVRRCDIDALFC